jgi:enoyl-CoA hydratase
MSQVRIETRDGVIWLVLDRAPVNALDSGFCNELSDKLDALAAEPEGGPVVLTGSGTTFCAGVDLKSVVRYDRSEQDDMLRALNRLFRAAYGFPRPLIGAINGHAIAGGLILALTCDMRLGAGGLFGLAEVRVGIPYPVAAIEIAKAELGAHARSFVLFGQPVSAEQACAMGVLETLCAPGDLIQKASTAARSAATLPAIGFARIKRQLRADVLGKADLAFNDDPLLGNWLSPETLSASASVLRR